MFCQKQLTSDRGHHVQGFDRLAWRVQLAEALRGASKLQDVSRWGRKCSCLPASVWASLCRHPVRCWELELPVVPPPRQPPSQFLSLFLLRSSFQLPFLFLLTSYPSLCLCLWMKIKFAPHPTLPYHSFPVYFSSRGCHFVGVIFL